MPALTASRLRDGQCALLGSVRKRPCLVDRQRCTAMHLTHAATNLCRRCPRAWRLWPRSSSSREGWLSVCVPLPRVPAPRPQPLACGAYGLWLRVLLLLPNGTPWLAPLVASHQTLTLACLPSIFAGPGPELATQPSDASLLARSAAALLQCFQGSCRRPAGRATAPPRTMREEERIQPTHCRILAPDVCYAPLPPAWTKCGAALGALLPPCAPTPQVKAPPELRHAMTIHFIPALCKNVTRAHWQLSGG